MLVDATTDKERIEFVLKHPEIWERVAEQHIDVSDYTIPDGPMYVMDNCDRALMIYHWQNCITLECHVHVLPEHRHIALSFGKTAIKWAWEKAGALKVVAQIPAIYPDVIKFAFKNGFEVEGLNRASYVKDGKVYDQVHVGIIRPEVKENGIC